MKRVFDRLVHFDKRSKKFPIRDFGQLPKRKSYTWSCKINLNQGSQGACTGFATAHEGAARPCVIKNVTERTAKKIYYRARELDPWPGEDYEGSTVLAAVKAAQELGWYPEYRWAFGESDLAYAVGYKGPAILGINWYTGMIEPGSNGIVKPNGQLEGGHAILCNGYNVKKHLYRLHNSWGIGWGINGDCFVSEDDMAYLLQRKGEACIPVRRAKG